MKYIEGASFSLDKTIEILERTPMALEFLTLGLSEFWIMNNEGDATWSVFDVLGHLVHADKTDWMVRTKLILSEKIDKHFEPLDRFAQLETSKGKSFSELIYEFRQVRMDNIRDLYALGISKQDLDKTGIHPNFGTVTLRQLLATWAVHDLDHIAQIARVMAKQYKEETGPWVEFLKVLRS